MSDNENPQHTARGQGRQNTDLAAGLIDVLMRGLEMAKRNIEGGRTVEGDFCLFIYADNSGHGCSFGYVKL